MKFDSIGNLRLIRMKLWEITKDLLSLFITNFWKKRIKLLKMLRCFI